MTATDIGVITFFRRVPGAGDLPDRPVLHRCSSLRENIPGNPVVVVIGTNAGYPALAGKFINRIGHALSDKFGYWYPQQMPVIAPEVSVVMAAALELLRAAGTLELFRMLITIALLCRGLVA